MLDVMFLSLSVYVSFTASTSEFGSHAQIIHVCIENTCMYEYKLYHY